MAVTDQLHMIVYDLGMPWERGNEIAEAYLKIFKRCPFWERMYHDLEKLYSLKGDSYAQVLGHWDGCGPTPAWLWRDYKAVGIIYVSEATLKG